MRMKSCVAALLATAIVALPVGAAIKAMNLAQLMSITDNAVHGTIIAKQSIRVDAPWPNAVYTKLTIEGASLRTGEVGTFEVVFHGSHDRRDDYIISEMPDLKDTRVGGEVVAFLEQDAPQVAGLDVVHSWAGLYRVERGFGQAVVIGKGKGSAFPANTALAEVNQRVLTTHADIAKLGKSPIPGRDK